MKLLIVLAGAVLAAAPVCAADRMTDSDVKALVSSIEKGRDQFDDALDGGLKRSIVRGPNGEVNVGRYLDDFQENIDRLEERLKPDYAASAEAATLLRQASAIDRLFRHQPAGTKGESEWNRLTIDLRTLAAAYGTEFPTGERATVRRIGDRELASNADALARSADQLKKSLDKDLKKDSTVEESTRESIVREADMLSDDAKALADRVKDGKPSSAEADRVMERAAKLEAFINAHQTPAASAAWAAIASPVQMLADAYRTTPVSAAR